METRHPAPILSADAGVLMRMAFGAPSGALVGTDSPAGVAWLRGVVLAGQGSFAAARSHTRAAVAGARPDAALARCYLSAVRCLDGSMLRQRGAHRAAASADGVALRLAHPLAGPGAAIEHLLTAATQVDALTGLAADALGTGRFDLAATLLQRSSAVLNTGGHGARHTDDPLWWTTGRAALRRAWVAAELAVYTGDSVGAARALEALIADDPGPSRPRHHAKTQLIAASAAAASANPGTAIAMAKAGHELAIAGGFGPLQWAGAKLLSVFTETGAGRGFAEEAEVVEARWVRAGANAKARQVGPL